MVESGGDKRSDGVGRDGTGASTDGRRTRLTPAHKGGDRMQKGFLAMGSERRDRGAGSDKARARRVAGTGEGGRNSTRQERTTDSIECRAER
jgi:hypothetical protein